MRYCKTHEQRHILCSWGDPDGGCVVVSMVEDTGDLWREVPNGVDGHWHDFSKPCRCGIGRVVWRNAPLVRVEEEPK